MSFKTIEMTKKQKNNKTSFKYTVFAIVGKIRVYIFDMAKQ